MRIKILSFAVSEGSLKEFSQHKRNQLFGFMHAHNELACLNRLLLFSMNSNGDYDLQNSADTVQMWCLLQVLVGKLFETWNMLREHTKNPLFEKLSDDHKSSLTWLKNYFGDAQLKRNALKLIRDKTAFHYDGLDFGQALNSLAINENNIYLARHPANSLYYLGSTIVFRTIFAMIADEANIGGSHAVRVKEGIAKALEDAQQANWHLHALLYGLIRPLLEEVAGGEMGEPKVLFVEDPQSPESISIPTFIQIGKMD